ncbi:FISUMP domain-containing protein [Williamwhitmania taraxaci]|uniref:Major paralogous domain-containing protein n=1 Tax=Williamwhitmania taraxaci TaxID=1640674 RepID=A0A1G6H8V0_9BACT|nr:FISUMP domain-containing protein [Williamwhitmania taraxaci]SDB90641.1 major paralogous domain-containing protein [Williamwhitmania taraxaci]
MNRIFYSALFAMLSFGCTGIVTAQDFETIKIGSQVWMAKNLSVEVPGSWCYDNNPENCKKYGRLYTYEAALKACPKGWHLPSSAEWSVLANFLGGEDVAGKALKIGGKSAMMLPLGGNRIQSAGFGLVGTYGSYWSSTRYDSTHAWYMYITDKNDYITLTYFTTAYGFSVRYIKN